LREKTGQRKKSGSKLKSGLFGGEKYSDFGLPIIPIFPKELTDYFDLKSRREYQDERSKAMILGSVEKPGEWNPLVSDQ
jgi:hypothetical protein